MSRFVCITSEEVANLMYLPSQALSSSCVGADDGDITRACLRAVQFAFDSTPAKSKWF